MGGLDHSATLALSPSIMYNDFVNTYGCDVSGCEVDLYFISQSTHQMNTDFNFSLALAH